MTDCALVTGASSGIGKAITAKLLAAGWEVYGIGRTFPEDPVFQQDLFHAVSLDLLDDSARSAFLDTLPKASLKLLINNAGAAWYGPHETISAAHLECMCRTNLELPMKLCSALLRPLRDNKGTILNIASVTALSVSPHGAAYGALKAGLLQFSRTLFEENRKAGLRVMTILPDMTDTGLYRNADFTASREPGCSLSPEQVADAVLYMLNQPEGSLITELTLRPQFHRIVRKKNAD